MNLGQHCLYRKISSPNSPTGGRMRREHGQEGAVKRVGSTLLAVLLLEILGLAQSPRPVPPGMRHAEELQAQNERDFPPPNPKRAAVKISELRGEAAQLAELASSIPAGVEHIGKGTLDKDLLQSLKRIEKLSKHLRNELDH